MPEPEALSAAGAERSIVSGGVVSSVKLRDALQADAFPAASTARARHQYVPSASVPGVQLAVEPVATVAELPLVTTVPAGGVCADPHVEPAAVAALGRREEAGQSPGVDGGAARRALQRRRRRRHRVEGEGLGGAPGGLVGRAGVGGLSLHVVGAVEERGADRPAAVGAGGKAGRLAARADVAAGGVSADAERDLARVARIRIVEGGCQRRRARPAALGATTVGVVGTEDAAGCAICAVPCRHTSLRGGSRRCRPDRWRSDVARTARRGARPPPARPPAARPSASRSPCHSPSGGSSRSRPRPSSDRQ